MKLSLSVGSGFLSKHKDYNAICLDLNRGKCDIIANGECLPFRKNLFSKIYLDAVLEHFDNPVKAVKEALRVSKKDCLFQIIIPVNSNLQRTELKRLITEFPFSLKTIVRFKLRRKRNRNIKGLGHKWQISLKWLKKYFNILYITKPFNHHYFYGRKAKLLRKYWRNRKIGGYEYFILGRKKNVSMS